VNRFTAYRAFDDAGVIQGRLVETSIDELSPGNIVVETAYSSVNYKDALAAAGINRIIRQYPRVTGIDMTGRIVSSDDSALPPGTEVAVHGFGLGVDHDGGHAQYGRFRSDQVMRLPAGLSLLEAATLGVAGYTAALAIDQMELNGLTPDKGPVLVNGATGGVASVAIDILSQRGFEVVAVSGKPESHDYLRAIGATEIINRHELEMGTKPLEKARWAGAVDSVGGPMLSWLTRTMQPDGVIAAFGNAGGAEIATTVMPFILRGVRLIGINGNSPMPLRSRVWQRMATDLRAPRLDRIATLAEPQAIGATMKTLLDSAGTGRTVIRFAG
jgi:putative YhdH/YhfP family quinone oxidoreductase